jgi:hypothetical protein
VSLAGTLLVAFVGGSAGSALALAGGVVLQGRQQRDERDRWARGRMEHAATTFGAAATSAQISLTATSWEHLYADKAGLLNGVVKRGSIVSEALVAVHMAFGDSSAATAGAFRVVDAIERCVSDLFELADDEPTDDIETWVSDREAFDQSSKRLAEARFEFTKLARAAVFVAPTTNAPP